MIRSLMVLLTLLGIMIFASDTPAWGNEKEEDIAIGKTVSLHSSILNEERAVFISVPPAYNRFQEALPVLYIMDGENSFLFATAVTRFLGTQERIPQMIVVAVANTDRTRDFTPTRVEERVASGGGERFLEFLEKELVPFVEKNYRTQPYRIFSGHSLCGMYAIYVLASRPDLFNAYIAMSPYLMYDEEVVLDLLKKRLETGSSLKKPLYVTVGKEPDYFDSLARLETLFNGFSSIAPNWKRVDMAREDHASIPLKSLYDGLEFIFADWRLSADAATSLEDVLRHYGDLTKKYGYTIPAPERVLNALGYRALLTGDIGLAVKILEHNVKSYPNSSNVYDSVGEAYEAGGELEKARESYKKAIELGEKSQDPGLDAFKKHLEQVNGKIGKVP